MNYPQYVAVAPKNNTLATTSLISAIAGWVLAIISACGGILWSTATLGLGAICVAPFVCLTFLAWLVAVITGHMAKNQIRQTGEAGDGQAAAGLIMGYIGLGLVAIGCCVTVVLTGGITILDSLPSMK
jgi:hypothetical protein